MISTVGREIDAWCTSCRMNLNHRIVAIVRGAPKRVECLTCNKQHNYRAPRGLEDVVAESKAPKTAAARAARAARTTAGQRDWQALVGDKDVSAFLPYSMSKTYTAGQLVEHPKFGRGYVKEALGTTKVAIVFREGPRTLIQGKTP
jgi:hypothetical protein